MKAINVHVGEVYEVRVSGNLARVRIVCVHPSGGWNGINEATGREIRLRSGRRLQRPVSKPADGLPGPCAVSDLFKF